jgi:hypothetical protein
LLYSSVVKQENTLINFSTAEKVAAAFNVMSGAEFLSGNELQAAVRTGNVGKSPPRRGRASSVSEDDFHAFCSAVFTFAAIKQINCTSRTKKMELMSLVGEILNSKRLEDGDDELGEICFYRRIELALCRKQNLSAPDKRESIRVKWLTHTAQKLNYQRWEETAVELGFARLPREGEDTNGEFIVWREGQCRRVINLDEMSLSLDSSSTRAGGRPASVPTAIGVHGDGDPAAKSGDKCTIIFGMNFASEAMPPFIQFPTKAKETSRYKLHSSLLASLRQVKGRFGYAGDRYFDTGIGMNPKGGMDKKSFYKYVTEFVCRLYPDAEDIPGKRVLIKIDSGPGRLHPELQQLLRARGFYMFPGVPNGTEVGQEMDQLYSYAKSLCYRNREKLVRARSDESTPLTLADVGWLVFGGEVPLPDGSSVNLEPAFDMAFDKEHLDRAKAKCGYCPSTRAALGSTKVRREVVLGSALEPSVDTEEDPIGKMYKEIECQNHEAVKFLIEKGYKTANKLKLSLRKVDANKVNGRAHVLTEPNTRERRDLLAKVSTAGQFFHVTNGGGPMNSNDALIAWGRKDTAKRVAALLKKKEALCAFQSTVRAVTALFERKPEAKWKLWTIPELKLVIGWKQGLTPKEPYNHPFKTSNKTQLQKLYSEEYCTAPDPVDATWTDEMENELDCLQKGEFEEVTLEEGLQRALDRDDEELLTRLKVKVASRRSNIITQAFCSLPKNKRQSLYNDLAMMVNTDDDELSMAGSLGSQLFDDFEEGLSNTSAISRHGSDSEEED